jgi:hypothetical protein
MWTSSRGVICKYILNWGWLKLAECVQLPFLGQALKSASSRFASVNAYLLLCSSQFVILGLLSTLSWRRLFVQLIKNAHKNPPFHRLILGFIYTTAWSLTRRLGYNLLHYTSENSNNSEMDSSWIYTYKRYIPSHTPLICGQDAVDCLKPTT